MWCEVWLPSEQRFAHCDPCERALDTPLMYELGWNKKLTHLLSFSRYGVVDALPRYSRKQNTVLVRRSAEVVNESFVAEIIAVKDKELEVGFAMRRVSLPVPTGVVNMHTTGGGLPWDVPIEGRVDASSQRGSSTATPLRMVVQGKAAVDSLCGEDVTWETLQHRKRLQQRELHALRLNTDITSATFTRQGRISGDLDWKLSRGEAGEATAVLATGDGAGAVCDPNAALCATGDAVVASKGAQILSIPPPAWMKALPSGVELVLTPHPSISSSAASGITDIIIATHRHQLLVNAVSQEQQKGLTTPAAADCYGWGGGLLPRVACVGETWVQLGSTGKSFSIGTDASATSTARIHSLPLNALGGAAQQGVGEVMLTKNGVTDPQPVPQYVAFRTVTATSNLGVKGANEENAQPQLLPLEGYTCSVPARILFPPEGDKSISGLTLLAKTQCLKDKSYLGFTVVADGKNNSSESSHAVLFGAAGYPLEALAGAVTYVKVISTTQQEQKKQEWKQQLLGSLSINNISDEGKGPALPQCSDRDGGCGGAEVVHAPSDADRAPAAVGATPAWDATTLCARRSYYHLGGAFHNDTVPFDSSAFLQAFNVVTNKTHCKSSCSGPDAFAEGPAVIRLSKIVVFAGACCFRHVTFFVPQSIKNIVPLLVRVFR